MNHTMARTLAILSGAGAMALSIAGVTMAASIPGYLPTYVNGNLLSNMTIGITYSLIGIAIAWTSPRNSLGWLFIIAAWFGGGLSAFGEPYGILSLHGHHLPAADWMAWIGQWAWTVGYLMGPTILLTLWPTGRPSGRWSRLLVIASATVIIILAAGYSVAPDIETGEIARLHQPIVWPGVTVLAPIVLPLVVMCLILSVVTAFRRLLRSSSPEREQLGWYFTVIVTMFTATLTLSPALSSAAQAVLILTLGWSLLWFGLGDLRLILRRTLVYGALATSVALLYALITGVLSAQVATGPVPELTAAVIVATGLLPFRDLLQRAATHLVYGEYRDPLKAVTKIGEGLNSPAGSLLQAVADAVAYALGSPSVTIQDATGAVIAQHGEPNTVGYITTLDHPGASHGRLIVAPRPSGERLDKTDQKVLTALAPHVALAVRAHDLATDLARSRQQLLTATLTERDRIRHDLHDGLGPALSGLALGLDATQNLNHDAQAIQQILTRTRTEAHRAATEVRRIIENLRPDILDERGLTGSLHAYTELINSTGTLTITLDTHETPPAIDPDTELVAYRITQEAITNVIRHSGAHHCTIRITTDNNHLNLEIQDDGRGITTPHDPGVGLTSIQQRATNLGGTVTIQNSAEGTLLRGQLPLTPIARSGAASQGLTATRSTRPPTTQK